MDSSENGRGVTQKPEESIYDRIGPDGFELLVKKALPYRSRSHRDFCESVYERILRESYSVQDVYEKHCVEYLFNEKFTKHRLLFRIVEYILVNEFKLPEKQKNP